MMYAIEHPQKGFVTAYNDKLKRVEFTEVLLRRLQFDGKEAAERWLEFYGLSNDGFQIIKVVKETTGAPASRAFHNPSIKNK